MEIHKEDIVKLESKSGETTKLGQIREIDGQAVRMGDHWYSLPEYQVTVLHSEVSGIR